MHHSEVRDETVEVNLLGNDGVTGDLLQVQTGLGDQVTGGQEVLQLGADVLVDSHQNTGHVLAVLEVDGHAAVDVGSDLLLDALQVLVDLLLDDHTVEETT